ncbi:MAG: MBL fold metallo-hydrolase [Candidatus Abyssobacteria bacterium SURF_17]|uniref:MBL fold metallo-hydrolase n=1 Tax=Candidatus Abyssobacteria bacterium SURF_17 TaxID=2093361 RepID=A0A419ENW0_9BACT|nr:MAG: MBL fold metallo-hydrolase [Candidatus Abyssubacteria bacterium SURF_17]
MTKNDKTNKKDRERARKNQTARKSAAKPEKDKAIQVINFSDVLFEHPRADVHVARILISNASWVNTTDGAVVIDTLLTPSLGRTMLEQIRETSGPVKYIIYTHGHLDHVGGAPAFLEDSPRIIAHRYVTDRFEKYRILSEHRARIAAMQFNFTFQVEKGMSFVNPTKTYDESMTFSLGGKTFELYHARAETDDHTWIFVPEIKTAFVGDLIIAGFPNIGNPFKPTRFALPWARALEAVRDKEPEMLIAHGGHAVYEGAEVKELLDVTIEAIHSVHDQVVDAINKDMPVDEMIHIVKLPEHLKDHRYLRFLYSRPEFAVYNIYRWYHGYFDHNPAHLLPRPEREVNEEIFNLIGDKKRILKRSKDLLEQGKAQLALQVLDIVLKHNPTDVEALKLHLKILEILCEEDYCLMSRNTWVHFMERDKELLRQSEG